MNDPVALPDDLAGVLAFLRAAERLKTTKRSAYTSAGEVESVAEHTWRVCLMVMALRPHFPDLDFGRLLEICVVHDLGEAIGGDVPAPEQARRLALDPTTGKAGQERADLLSLLEPLPAAVRTRFVALWDEYEAAVTPEARLAKAVDKLETILQHTQGANPPNFDYRFNLGYGRRFTDDDPVIAALRRVLDEETERRAREAESVDSGRTPSPQPLMNAIISSLPDRETVGLRTVAVFEAAKGLIVLLAGSGLLLLIHRDLQDIGARLIDHLHLNPASHYPEIFLRIAGGATPRRLRLLALGAALYSAIRLTEAAGLWWGKSWAEWLGVLTGLIYVPFELISLIRRPGPEPIVALVANLAIVALLARALRRRRRAA